MNAKVAERLESRVARADSGRPRADCLPNRGARSLTEPQWAARSPTLSLCLASGTLSYVCLSVSLPYVWLHRLLDRLTSDWTDDASIGLLGR